MEKGESQVMIAMWRAALDAWVELIGDIMALDIDKKENAI